MLGSWHVLQQSRHVYHEFPEFYKSSEIYSWTSHTYVDFSTAPLLKVQVLKVVTRLVVDEAVAAVEVNDGRPDFKIFRFVLTRQGRFFFMHHMWSA